MLEVISYYLDQKNIYVINYKQGCSITTRRNFYSTCKQQKNMPNAVLNLTLNIKVSYSI